MTTAPRSAIGFGLLLLAAGCGGAPEPQAQPAPVPSSAGAEAPKRGETMQVSGLHGTIPEREIRGTLEPKFPQFQRCFARSAERVEWVSGHMEFYFHVALDGSVEWVYPRASTIGDRETERCLLQIAAATHFPKPRGGGPAELAFSFDIDPSDEVRPPLELDASRVGAAVASARGAVESCGAGAFDVTVYVAPGGQVIAAGAAADSTEAAERIDCVLQAVRGMAMPDPGSYPAKVSFRVP